MNRFPDVNDVSICSEIEYTVSNFKNNNCEGSPPTPSMLSICPSEYTYRYFTHYQEKKANLDSA